MNMLTLCVPLDTGVWVLLYKQCSINWQRLLYMWLMYLSTSIPGPQGYDSGLFYHKGTVITTIFWDTILTLKMVFVRDSYNLQGGDSWILTDKNVTFRIWRVVLWKICKSIYGVCEAYRVDTTSFRLGWNRPRRDIGRWDRIPHKEHVCPCGVGNIQAKSNVPYSLWIYQKHERTFHWS